MQRTMHSTMQSTILSPTLSLWRALFRAISMKKSTTWMSARMREPKHSEPKDVVKAILTAVQTGARARSAASPWTAAVDAATNALQEAQPLRAKAPSLLSVRLAPLEMGGADRCGGDHCAIGVVVRFGSAAGRPARLCVGVVPAREGAQGAR